MTLAPPPIRTVMLTGGGPMTRPWQTWFLDLVKAIGTGGGGGATYADSETPSGTIGGGNQTFTLAHTPSPLAGLQLFLKPVGFGGLMMIQGVDYTLSGATITMTVAPTAGEALLAFYRY